MYFFYHPTTRKIISGTAMGLSPEDLATLQPPGSEVIEEDIDNLPNWRGELADYYITDEGSIAQAFFYSEFSDIIKVKVGESYSWEVYDDNTCVYDLQRKQEHYPSVGEVINFYATDPGIYKFEISSKTFKTGVLKLEVSL